MSKKEKLERISKRVNKNMRRNSSDYPDCYEASKEVGQKIKEEFDDPYVSIAEYIAGEYKNRHYAVKVDFGIDYPVYVVDPTFGQFTNERETFASFGSRNEVSDVVVVEAKEYVFFPDYNSSEKI